MPLNQPRRIEPGPPPLTAPPPLSAQAALFLDFDGTLAELAPRPESVTVPEFLPKLLDALVARLDGAVAVITGRPLAEVDALLAPVSLPGAGLHGAELRTQGGARVTLRTVAGIEQLALALRAKFAGDPRLLLEDKGAVLALHFRQAPERAQDCAAALRELTADRSDLEVILGNRVVEARPRGSDKGHALRRLLSEAPFAGRLPVFAGDDRTDEDAFAAVVELGGYGIKVGTGPTAAQYRCAGVTAVHAWLRSSLRPRGRRS